MSKDDDSFMHAIEARNRALANLDMEYARRMIPLASSDDVRLVALHKARYDCTQIASELRHESGAWLRKQGLSRVTGEPLLPEGELPK